MTYIHELPGWPALDWDAETLTAPLAALRHEQGRHIATMQGMGFDARAEASLEVLTADVVKSWAIEGEALDAGEVRSSIARRLGLDVAGLPPAGREVDGVVEMMLDATQRCREPLSAERLFGWHAALFPTGRSGLSRITVGAWRTDASGPMRVVSGSIGKERIHFEAPAARHVETEMGAFIDWFNDPRPQGAALDPVLKAGLAHLWFTTIHPFEDGNGRIARAIGDMALARADGTEQRFYSLSAQIESERQDYYRELEAAQRGELDVTPWLEWFLGCLDRAIAGARETLSGVLYRARVWQTIEAGPVNTRQRQVIRRMLEDFRGHLTTSKYAKLTGCSADTALRDIRELLERGILLQNPGGGRSTSYRLAEPAPNLPGSSDRG